MITNLKNITILANSLHDYKVRIQGGLYHKFLLPILPIESFTSELLTHTGIRTVRLRACECLLQKILQTRRGAPDSAKAH
jgi:hypothetical protein